MTVFSAPLHRQSSCSVKGFLALITAAKSSTLVVFRVPNYAFTMNIFISIEKSFELYSAMQKIICCQIFCKKGTAALFCLAV